MPCTRGGFLWRYDEHYSIASPWCPQARDAAAGMRSGLGGWDEHGGEHVAQPSDHPTG